jgi:hypothetical protein
MKENLKKPGFFKVGPPHPVADDFRHGLLAVASRVCECLGFRLGIEAWVGCGGHGCLEFMSPGFELGMKFVTFLRVVGGEVARLTDVRTKVVELEPAVFEVLVELPISPADDRAGARPKERVALLSGGAASITLQIRREVPEQRTVRECGGSGGITREQRDEADPVERLLGERGPCDLTKRGKEIDADHGR